jgi:hypothetical protein
MTKLPETSETELAIIFLVVNLSQLLRQFFGLFLSFLLFLRTNELRRELVFDKNYVYSSLPQVKLITWVTNHWHLIARFLECLFQQTLSNGKERVKRLSP